MLIAYPLAQVASNKRWSVSTPARYVDPAALEFLVSQLLLCASHLGAKRLGGRSSGKGD